jgi:predicted DNA-binding antitoxin AbrB/MazE fold protein
VRGGILLRETEMTKLVSAIYEKGVFRPTEPIALTEGTKAVVQVEESSSSSELWRNPAAAAETLIKVASESRPTSEADDASVNHDKYLYGEQSE